MNALVWNVRDLNRSQMLNEITDMIGSHSASLVCSVECKVSQVNLSRVTGCTFPPNCNSATDISACNRIHIWIAWSPNMQIDVLLNLGNLSTVR